MTPTRFATWQSAIPKYEGTEFSLTFPRCVVAHANKEIDRQRDGERERERERKREREKEREREKIKRLGQQSDSLIHFTFH